VTPASKNLHKSGSLSAWLIRVEALQTVAPISRPCNVEHLEQRPMGLLLPRPL
jgi:hypothetical protein